MADINWVRKERNLTGAGKGDKLRKGADLNTYRDNYDSIFRKPKPEEKQDETQTKPGLDT